MIKIKKGVLVIQSFIQSEKWRDRAWKEALCNDARGAIEYLMPDLARDMDTTKEIHSISGMELFSEGTDSDRYMRVLDVFFDITMQNEESENLAFFIEQQEEKEPPIARRVFETYIRLRERRRMRTTGLVLYTGNLPDVNTYSESCYGFNVSVEFRTFHLNSKKLDELRKDDRPFGQVMLAGRLASDAGDSLELREKYALEMLNTTLERDYDAKKKLSILTFSRRIFRLNDSRISERVKEEYKLKTIPLSEYQEQVKLDNVREEGLEEGIEKGKVEGMMEAARSMFAEGLSPDIIKKCTGLNKEDILALS